MSTLFTRIIEGDLPGRFVWEDEQSVAFLTIAPISRGHTLVVPKVEVDHWIDADPSLWSHLSEVARTVGRAIDHAFSPARVALVVAGFEVDHLHIHVLGAGSERDVAFDRADPGVAPERLDGDRAAIREALVAIGAGHGVPSAR